MSRKGNATRVSETKCICIILVRNPEEIESTENPKSRLKGNVNVYIKKFGVSLSTGT
jgi:hypothetical protein